MENTGGMRSCALSLGREHFPSEEARERGSVWLFRCFIFNGKSTKIFKDSINIKLFAIPEIREFATRLTCHSFSVAQPSPYQKGLSFLHRDSSY